MCELAFELAAGSGEVRPSGCGAEPRAAILGNFSGSLLAENFGKHTVERRSTGPCLAAHSHPVVPHPTRYGTMSSLVEWSPSSVSRVYSIRESGNQRRRCVLLRPRRSHRTLGSVRYSWYLRREGLSPK